MNLQPYICKQCGGRINVTKMRCEYCGVDYHDPSLKRLTIQQLKPGTARLRAQVQIPKERMLHNPEGARDYTLRELRNQLADGLLAYMRIETADDFMNNAEIIRGEVRVIEPMSEDRW